MLLLTKSMRIAFALTHSHPSRLPVTLISFLEHFALLSMLSLLGLFTNTYSMMISCPLVHSYALLLLSAIHTRRNSILLSQLDPMASSASLCTTRQGRGALHPHHARRAICTPRWPGNPAIGSSIPASTCLSYLTSYIASVPQICVSQRTRVHCRTEVIDFSTRSRSRTALALLSLLLGSGPKSNAVLIAALSAAKTAFRCAGVNVSRASLILKASLQLRHPQWSITWPRNAASRAFETAIHAS